VSLPGYNDPLSLRNFFRTASVLPPVQFMKTKLPLVALLAVAAFASGCATRTNTSGGKETNVLGGAVTVSRDSFQPTTPATVDTDISKIVGKNGPSGKRVSLFWGLLTFQDY
jgi:hypothetical protein